MTYGFLMQLVFCKKCGLLVLVTPFLSGAPPPKKNPVSPAVRLRIFLDKCVIIKDLGLSVIDIFSVEMYTVKTD